MLKGFVSRAWLIVNPFPFKGIRAGFVAATLALLLAACGVDGKRFRVEGRFLNLNRGEFYVYSTNGLIDGIDTVKLEGGRFTYDIPCEREGTLVMVFPNFSEQPIFAQPGKSVDIEGDASHLKELTVKGTKDNKLMNQFREAIVNASPPQVAKIAAMFAADNPTSLVSVYLVRRYFITTPTPNYKEAERLVKLLLVQQPKNGELNRMQTLISTLAKTSVGAPLPAFQARSTKGEKVSQQPYNKAAVAVFNVWSTTNMQSMEIQRMLKQKVRDSKGKLQVVSLCVDPILRECNDVLQRDSISWPNICDGAMFEGDVAKKLGIYTVPFNILLKNGKIIARDLDNNQLKEQLDKLL
ncbi:redoxin family protein [Prevotella sp. oral taxon 472 str. F0295]|nr:redoxin family protein [Prevotella sp. oral taxon 472 str. F0295]